MTAALEDRVVSSEQSPAPVLDPGQILSTIGSDPDMIREFVALAFDDIEPQVSRLAGAAATNDLDALAKAAHAVKGVALSLGAKRLAEAAKSTEQAAKAARPDDYVEHIEQIKRELVSLRGAIAGAPDGITGFGGHLPQRGRSQQKFLYVPRLALKNLAGQDLEQSLQGACLAR